MQLESVAQILVVIILSYSAIVQKMTFDQIKELQEDFRILEKRFFDHISNQTIHQKT